MAFQTLCRLMSAFFMPTDVSLSVADFIIETTRSGYFSHTSKTTPCVYRLDCRCTCTDKGIHIAVDAGSSMHSDGVLCKQEGLVVCFPA